MPTALFLGRFQPVPHKGHVQVIEEILAKHDKIIIGLGSSQYSGTYDDLLTIEERTQLFEAVFEGLGVSRDRYGIVAIPDIHDNDRYVDHVKQFVGEVDTMYSGNELVARLFTEKGYDVVTLPRYGSYEGKILREKMKVGDVTYAEMIPTAVLHFVDQFDIVGRLKASKTKN